mmetsp:Transcript_87852/g.256795  ORF Transcript_87852/g.256795 Transcript_87852/m.256795 type:complete len:249 (+) Transcript_87852:90-836(+)
MCEPISIAIGCGVFCCCLCTVFIGMGIVAGAVGGPLAAVLVEVGKCVNGTIGSDFSETELKAGPCGQVEEQHCDDDNHSAACDLVRGKCACDVVGRLMRNSTELESKLHPCCDEIQGLEGAPLLGDLVNESTLACHEMITGAVDELEQVHENCTKGIYPAPGTEFVPTDGIAMPQMDFQAIHPLRLAHRAAFGSAPGLFGASAAAGLLIVVAAATLGLRRTRRALRAEASECEALAPSFTASESEVAA